MANLFIIKHKVFEPNKPFVKFKPGTTTSLVGAKNSTEAINKATNELLAIVREKFPSADIKVTKCQPINYDRFFK